MVRGLAKWRRKTVNFADNLFEEAAKALSQKPMEAKATPKKPAVVTAPKVVVIGDNQETGKVEKAAELTPAIPVTSPSTMPGYKEVAPDQVPANAIQMGVGRLVIAIGSDPFNMTMMTANAGGSIGKFREVLLYSVSFLPTSLTNSWRKQKHTAYASILPDKKNRPSYWNVRNYRPRHLWKDSPELMQVK